MQDEEKFEITEEERQHIISERVRKSGLDTIEPPGIGTGNIWAKARIKKKKFIDDATFIDKEGKR